jgi:hypothetical protein
MHFTTKNNSVINLDITCVNEIITNISNFKFLGLEINSTLTWKNHIDMIVPKLSKACYAISTMKPFVSLAILRMIYYTYFHSNMNYGIIFWGNSSGSTTIFKLQKRIIRIMMGARPRDSCRKYFRNLKILPLQSQYIFSLVLYVVANKSQFILNSEIHGINTSSSRK